VIWVKKIALEQNHPHGPTLGNRSNEAMKRCDEELNASSLQFLRQRLTLHRFIALIFCHN
jgi:hypothetical protein